MSPCLKTSKWRFKWTKISRLHVQLCSNSRLSRGKFLFIVPVHLELTVLLCAQRQNNKKDRATCFCSNLHSEKKVLFYYFSDFKAFFVMIYCNKRDRLELLSNTKVAASLQSRLPTPTGLREVNPVYNQMIYKSNANPNIKLFHKLNG
jgi:hypothetical protein